jgi:hypothetical protein
MKKFFTYVIFSSAFAITTQAQNFDRKNIALCYFYVSINPSLGVIPTKAIVDSIYNRITEVLYDSSEIEISPADFLKNKVAYFMGYPFGTAKKAAKSQMSKEYAKIVMDISPQGILSTKDNSLRVDQIGKEKKTIHSKIKVALSMIIYDENGEKIKEAEAKSVSKEKIVFDSESLLVGDFSLINKKVNADNFNSFQETLYNALIELSQQLK